MLGLSLLISKMYVLSLLEHIWGFGVGRLRCEKQ